MFTTAADRLVAATKSSQTPLRWLLGMRRIPVLDWRERLVCFWRGSQQVDMAVSGRRSGGSATPSTRTASPEPEPKTPDDHCAFGEQSRATGLQMPPMSSTIPAPAITISEAAPAPAQKPAAHSSA